MVKINFLSHKTHIIFKKKQTPLRLANFQKYQVRCKKYTTWDPGHGWFT